MMNQQQPQQQQQQPTTTSPTSSQQQTSTQLQAHQYYQNKFKLFFKREIDEPDPLEISWRECYEKIEQLLLNSNETEFNNSLIERSSMDINGGGSGNLNESTSSTTTSNKYHTEITIGLLYAILIVTPNNIHLANQYFKSLTFFTKDSLSLFCTLLKKLIADKFQKLNDLPKQQILWIVNELIVANHQDSESVASIILRHIYGGNFNPKNLQLGFSMLTIFITHKTWLYSKPLFIPIALYNYLRLIQDHVNKPPSFNQLYLKDEINFCMDLLKNKFQECLVIGRDLIRLLQYLGNKLPEFEQFWKDLNSKPTSFSSSYLDISQSMKTPTPKHFLQSRLSPEMELQVLYILKEVKFGNQKRYQQWFVTKYLLTPESESLIPDIIRYICCVYHPPNHVLCSDIVPRWAIIGWLLKHCKSDAWRNYSKLSLFLDWLYYEPKTDSIMNIEPAILLMAGSVKKYADMTIDLVEFIVGTLLDGYDPQRKDLIRQGIHNSFATLLDKGVVQSLNHVFPPDSLGPALFDKVKHYFYQFLTTSPIHQQHQHHQQQQLHQQLHQQQQQKPLYSSVGNLPTNKQQPPNLTNSTGNLPTNNHGLPHNPHQHPPPTVKSPPLASNTLITPTTTSTTASAINPTVSAASPLNRSTNKPPALDSHHQNSPLQQSTNLSSPQIAPQQHKLPPQQMPPNSLFVQKSPQLKETSIYDQPPVHQQIPPPPPVQQQSPPPPLPIQQPLKTSPIIPSDSLPTASGKNIEVVQNVVVPPTNNNNITPTTSASMDIDQNKPNPVNSIQQQTPPLPSTKDIDMIMSELSDEPPKQSSHSLIPTKQQTPLINSQTKLPTNNSNTTSPLIQPNNKQPSLQTTPNISSSITATAATNISTPPITSQTTPQNKPTTPTTPTLPTQSLVTKPSAAVVATPPILEQPTIVEKQESQSTTAATTTKEPLKEQINDIMMELDDDSKLNQEIKIEIPEILIRILGNSKLQFQPSNITITLTSILSNFNEKVPKQTTAIQTETTEAFKNYLLQILKAELDQPENEFTIVSSQAISAVSAPISLFCNFQILHLLFNSTLKQQQPSPMLMKILKDIYKSNPSIGFKIIIWSIVTSKGGLNISNNDTTYSYPDIECDSLVETSDEKVNGNHGSNGGESKFDESIYKIEKLLENVQDSNLNQNILQYYLNFQTSVLGNEFSESRFVDQIVLDCLQANSANTFNYLVPILYRNCSNVLVGNSDFLYLVLSCITPRQHFRICNKISMGEFRVFGSDDLKSLYDQSSKWESWEQNYFWQMLIAEDSVHSGMIVKEYSFIVGKLDAYNNCEVLQNLTSVLKDTKFYDFNIFSETLQLGDHFYTFVMFLFTFWLKNNTTQTFNYINQIIDYYLTTNNNNNNQASNNGTNNNNNKNNKKLVEKILYYYNLFLKKYSHERIKWSDMIDSERISKVLQKSNNSNLIQKYSNLYNHLNNNNNSSLSNSPLFKPKQPDDDLNNPKKRFRKE